MHLQLPLQRSLHTGQQLLLTPVMMGRPSPTSSSSSLSTMSLVPGTSRLRGTPAGYLQAAGQRCEQGCTGKVVLHSGYLGVCGCKACHRRRANVAPAAGMKHEMLRTGRQRM